ncbi:hypothetical protein [Metabacillus idriensis]|nr:hypothetical protein [Metabacillus idriensis]
MELDNKKSGAVLAEGLGGGARHTQEMRNRPVSAGRQIRISQ